MANSDADTHDLDKLVRWRRGLAEAGTSGFPVIAVFLVGLEDRRAHDVFREFRTTFEARNTPYENLIIFGQHGVSKTLLGMTAGFGLPKGDSPLLALVSSPTAGTVYTIPLESGTVGEAGEAEPWRDVLRHIEAASETGEERLDLEPIKEVEPHSIRGGSLESVINRLLIRLS